MLNSQELFTILGLRGEHSVKGVIVLDLKRMIPATNSKDLVATM